MTASGDEPLQMQFLYWGIAPLIALGAATWKAAGMRGSQHENWSARVTVLKTGLDEQAIQELESLRESIDELLGAEDDAPVAAIAEPAELLQSVRRFEKMMKTHRRVDANFKWLLRLGNILVVSMLLMIVGVICGALFLSKLVESSFLWITSLSLVGIGLLAVTACFFVYWTLQNKLSNAEELAQANNY